MLSNQRITRSSAQSRLIWLLGDLRPALVCCPSASVLARAVVRCCPSMPTSGQLACLQVQPCTSKFRRCSSAHRLSIARRGTVNRPLQSWQSCRELHCSYSVVPTFLLTREPGDTGLDISRGTSRVSEIGQDGDGYNGASSPIQSDISLTHSLY